MFASVKIAWFVSMAWLMMIILRNRCGYIWTVYTMKYFSKFQMFFNKGSFQISLSDRKISIKSKLKRTIRIVSSYHWTNATYLTRNHRMNGIYVRMISSNMYRNLRSITMIVTTKRTEIETFLLRFFQSMEIDMLTSVDLSSCFIWTFRTFIKYNRTMATWFTDFCLRKWFDCFLFVRKKNGKIYRLEFRTDMFIEIIDSMRTKCTFTARKCSFWFIYWYLHRKCNDGGRLRSGWFHNVTIGSKTIDNHLFEIGFIFDSFPNRSF